MWAAQASGRKQFGDGCRDKVSTFRTVQSGLSLVIVDHDDFLMITCLKLSFDDSFSVRPD